MMDVSASEVQTFYSKPIIFGGLVLLDITPRFERREQTKYVVLMQLEPFRKFSDAEFVDLAKELLKHVERMRDGLNYVVCFVASDHQFFMYPRNVQTVTRVRIGKVF